MKFKKNILCLSNPTKPDSIKFCAEIAQKLSGDKFCNVLDSKKIKLSEFESSRVAAIVAFGGDGTLLHVVNQLRGLDIPIMTVNMGTLGFLAETNPDVADIEDTLSTFFKTGKNVSKRMMLQASVCRGNKSEARMYYALNEFAFVAKEQGRVCKLELRVDGKELTTIVGDGVIVASPTGSTAYALSAGGPILSPESKAVELVPICPHKISNRPIVFSNKEEIVVGGTCKINCDGYVVAELHENGCAFVSGSNRFVRLIVNSRFGRYDVLRAKLGWSE